MEVGSNRPSPTESVILPTAEKPYGGKLAIGQQFSVCINLLEPNSFDEHSHPQTQLKVFLNASGEASWRTKSGQRVAQPLDGDVAWIVPANQRHAFRLTKATRVLAVYMESSLTEEISRHRLRHVSLMPLQYYTLHDSMIADLVSIIRGFFERRPGENYLLMTGGLLAYQVLNVHLEPRRLELQEPHGLSDAAEKRIRKYIEDHYAYKLTRAAMADEVGLSSWHFGRMFKITFGMPPGRYVKEFRLKRAKELFDLDPNATVTRVSEDVGFSDLNQFTFHFKKRFDVTPSVYLARVRARARNQE